MIAQQEDHTYHDPHFCSHVFLLIVSFLLSLFSGVQCLGFALSVFSYKHSSGLDTIAILFLILTFAIILISISTIMASCRESPKWMWLFQVVTILLFGIYIIIFFLVVMRDLDFIRNDGSYRENCEPKNFFQSKMQDISVRASELLCSDICPCPNYTIVQQCPTWTFSPYDEMLQVTQNFFNCSGWCSVNSKKKFVFNKDKGFEVSKSCYHQWMNWTTQKWKKSMVYLLASILLIGVNIVATSYRCLQLSKQTTESLFDEDEEVN